MTPKRAVEFLSLVQALADGKQIEFRPNGETDYHPVDHISFKYRADQYRARPEARVYYANEYTDGSLGYPAKDKLHLIRDNYNVKRVITLKEVLE